MFARITFEQQQILKSQAEELRKTLSDQVDFEVCVIKENGKIGTLYSWNETLDPEESKIVDDKGKHKELVFVSDYVQLSSGKEYICDIDLFFSKHPDIKVKLRGLPKTAEVNYQGVIQQILAIQEKFESALSKFDKQIQFNEKVDVHVGGFALMNINQVGYFEDGCTGRLQEILNEGWHILAVNVQPDTRRPDYILGRYNPNETNGKVEVVHFK